MGSAGPYPTSQDPLPAHLQSAPDSRPPSPHSTPPVPTPSLPAAISQAISTASSQQASDFTAARDLAQVGRVHTRENEAGGLDEQPRKKLRTNKWDQQEPDIPTSDASPASQVPLTDICWTLCWMVSGHWAFDGPILQGSGQHVKCLGMKEALYICLGPCLCVLQTAHLRQVCLADNKTLCVVWLPLMFQPWSGCDLTKCTSATLPCF